MDGLANIVVCDSGSAFIKAGFAGLSTPAATIPSVVGYPPWSDADLQHTVLERPRPLVGDEAVDHPTVLSYPLFDGHGVRDWAGACTLWDHVFFDALAIDPKECKLLLTERPLASRREREKMAEIMFEKYGWSQLALCSTGELALYAHGLVSGLVVEVGASGCHVCPVWEGNLQSDLYRRLELGGGAVTARLLQLRGYALDRTMDRRTVGEIKERLCYVAADLAMERQLAAETTALGEPCTLPDGRVMRTGAERFLAPEILFQPELADLEELGLSEVVFYCLSHADVELRGVFCKHIVLSGGSTLFPGFATRLERDLRALWGARMAKGDAAQIARFQCRIDDESPLRRHLPFTGGSVYAQVMKDRDASWVSKAEWADKGAAALQQKIK